MACCIVLTKFTRLNLPFLGTLLTLFQFWLKSGHNYGNCTGRCICGCVHFIQVTTVSNVSCRGKWNIFYVEYTFYYVLRFSRYLNKTRDMHVLYWWQRCDFVGSYCVYEKMCRFKGPVHQTYSFICNWSMAPVYWNACTNRSADASFAQMLAYNREFTNLIAWLPAILKLPVGLWFVCRSG